MIPKDNYYNNKIIWITGASSGIGEALAIELNKQGAVVILSARNLVELERVKGLFSYSNNVFILPLDMLAHQTFESKTKVIIDQYHKIDMLINNAGISQRSFAIDTEFIDDKKIIDTNLLGPIALTKSVLPYFIKQNSGHIINISSVMGKINTQYRTSYAASKHGLLGYFDCLRLELNNTIKITNIMPGFINTNIVKNAISKTFVEQNLNAKGLSAKEFSIQALKAISAQKKEVYIGGFKERFALFMKHFFPNIFDTLIKNKKVI